MSHKTCLNDKCLESNPQSLSSFYKNKSAKDGLYSTCKKCTDLRNKEWATNNPKRHKEYKNEWYNENKEKTIARALEWSKNNKEKRKKFKKIWYENNLDRGTAYAAKRRAVLLEATPSWLTNRQVEEITEFYTLAKELQWLSEEPFHVDHIVPLQGETICGLHVPWNLQILPASDNIRKHNKLE